MDRGGGFTGTVFAEFSAGVARLRRRVTSLATIAQSGCLEKLAKAADAKLNDVYRGAIKSIESSDPEHAAAWKVRIEESEQAWIAFRDADCGALTAYEWGHGTGMGAATRALTFSTRPKQRDARIDAAADRSLTSGR